MVDNGRPVSNRELNDKLTLVASEFRILRQEDRAAHFKTRVVVIPCAFFGAMAGKLAAPVVLSFLHFL